MGLSIGFGVGPIRFSAPLGVPRGTQWNTSGRLGGMPAPAYQPAPAWYPNPGSRKWKAGKGKLRYFDGHRWTDWLAVQVDGRWHIHR